MVQPLLLSKEVLLEVGNSVANESRIMEANFMGHNIFLILSILNMCEMVISSSIGVAYF